jgi:type II protein arginine methyltransferase
MRLSSTFVIGANWCFGSVLVLTPPLPTNAAGVLDRWAAEPVQHVFLPASTFIANFKGSPVLPKVTQTFIRQCMIVSFSLFCDRLTSTNRSQHRPTFILSGVDSGVHTMGGEPAYSQYLKHLEKSSLVVQATKMEGSVEYFAQAYQDYLQNPLQVRPYNS